ncbi:hypothetical protein LLE49_22390 [Alicyclobacillus tolerans]|uniref:hypothetical protein n=1 Tax=Alicyclobacillus tolerans TaxID=90970 RepID=UPI001F3F00CB|nr:hypothetical protein [Alicyclobacillus tolerans]MCF8567472.1 hypothetical protein [Alicyclobacillus tolerans]
MKKRNLIFAGAIVLAASATAVSFAQNAATATISATPSSSSAAQIYQADTTLTGSTLPANSPSGVTSIDTSGKNGHAVPGLSPLAQAVGSVGSGDLYVVAPSSGDILVTVYLSNAGQLANNYGYMNFQVSVYPGTWSVASGTDTFSFTGSNPAAQTTGSGGQAATAVLSLTNGYVTFDLPGGTSNTSTSGTAYSISIDSGSYYCSSTSGNNLAPSFYATVQPSAS